MVSREVNVLILGEFTGFDWDDGNRGKNWRLHGVSDTECEQVFFFISTQGYTFLRDKKTGRPALIVQYTFPKAGAVTVACSVQDDQGGERTVVQTLQVK